MADTPALSDVWYRVADLHPKLRPHARLHRHQYRGRVWHLLQDPASGRVNRLGRAAWQVIGMLDGQRSVDQIWQEVSQQLGDSGPTQDEIIHLLAQLHMADLLQSNVAPDLAELFARSQRDERARARQSFGNPMAIRVPLWDPDAFLSRFPQLIQLIWSRVGGLIWLAVVLPALVLLLEHWPELSNNFSDRILTVDNIIVLYFVFPIIKLLHEMGHATATKAGGGEVHDLGLTLLVLLPVPYVDASAATVFRSKYQRAIVGAAGVMVELFIAALAFYLWLALEPGVVRGILFNVMLIAGVSSLLFNGNPLLRYDAYYILADLIEVPNLATRAAEYWGRLVEHYAFGVPADDAAGSSAGERRWFLVYGLTSAIYRVVVALFIILFIAGKFFFVGVIMALWAVAAMAVTPILRASRYLAHSARLHGHRGRAMAATVGGTLGLLGLLTLLPMPFHTVAEGVVWAPEEVLIRADAAGFLRRTLVPAGSMVKPGQAVMALEDLDLQSELASEQGRLAELQATYEIDRMQDLKKSQLTWQELAQVKAKVASLQRRVAELIVRAKAGGQFVVVQAQDVAGRYFRKGDLIGYAMGPGQPVVRVVVPQDAADLIRQTDGRIELRAVDLPELTRQGRISRMVPSGEAFLPSRALSVEGGGEIATDPRETKGAKALQRMFQVDVAVQDAEAAAYFGQRVFVRFEHAPMPLGYQWYHRIRLLFLSHFSV